MEKINSRELAKMLAQRQNCYIVDAKSVLDHLTAIITESLASGKAVYYAGLGTFYPVPRRRYRKQACPGFRVKFRASRSLSQQLKEVQREEKEEAEPTCIVA